MLGFVKCEDVQKFWSAFLASVGDDESVFVDPPQEERDNGGDDPTNDGKLLDKYDDFLLKPQKLLKNYTDNHDDAANFVATNYG